MPQPKRRILFAAYHSLIDPSSGASLATRRVLELLAGSGFTCEALCASVLDFPAKVSQEQLLALRNLPFEKARLRNPVAVPYPRNGGTSAAKAASREHTLLRVRAGALPVTIFLTRETRQHDPTPQEGAVFLAAFDATVARFRPDVLLTYGGQWVADELRSRARKRGIAVVFGLHNFAYRDRRAFSNVDAVVVPSRYAQEKYRREVGIQTEVLPYPVDPAEVVAQWRSPKYVTMVNPEPAKGLFVFARIAEQLAKRRPDIPLLVVESRGRGEWLQETGIDLSFAKNVFAMATTHDPRDFYRVTKVLLVPSLWEETFGLVAAEAMANGIPVLGSDRGALPEILAGAGAVLPIPASYGPDTRVAPTAEEVSPWVERILRLWDNDVAYAEESCRARTIAEQWFPSRLTPLYRELFSGVQVVP